MRKTVPLNPEELVEKLPKWAQWYIEELQRTIQSKEREIADLLQEREEYFSERGSDVTWEYLMEGERSIPSRSNVHFYVDPKKRSYISVCWTGDSYANGVRSIDVSSSLNGIAVMPLASNRVRISLFDAWGRQNDK